MVLRGEGGSVVGNEDDVAARYEVRGRERRLGHELLPLDISPICSALCF